MVRRCNKSQRHSAAPATIHTRVILCSFAARSRIQEGPLGSGAEEQRTQIEDRADFLFALSEDRGGNFVNKRATTLAKSGILLGIR
ncbi:hypothetical protein L596_015700 [Steinernema carpocapsae]|uniref:Uncharacterized protein n=1 Tax=Steinernema carpocapsae TaxID=34508 RepID=A0A4U5NGU4_STECR|nr:hypothetical protein L596_015700 [Steinernema carpocapsae]